MNGRVLRNWKEFIEIWQFCHYTRIRKPLVLTEQVGDKGLIWGFGESGYGYIFTDS